MTYEHPYGFSCEDIDDRCGDLELALADGYRILGKVADWADQALTLIGQGKPEEDWLTLIRSIEATANEETGKAKRP